MAQMVKNLPAKQESRVRSLGGKDSLEKEMATHSSTLGVPLGGTRRVGRLLGVAGRLSGTVSPFRAEQGTSLESPGQGPRLYCSVLSGSLNSTTRVTRF